MVFRFLCCWLVVVMFSFASISQVIGSEGWHLCLCNSLVVESVTGCGDDMSKQMWPAVTCSVALYESKV